MCGRFTLTITINEAAQQIMSPQTVAVPSQVQQASARYNIAPTQSVAAILNNSSSNSSKNNNKSNNGKNSDQTQEKETDFHVELLRWGLIPSWAKEASIGSRMINARAETLAEKPSFKRLLTSRRCLILADGFYEWMQEPGSRSKTPMYIMLKNQECFAFAGLWDSWQTPEGERLSTCTIVTTTPNELMSSIHKRMPVILPREARELWLDPTMRDTQALLSVLGPYAADEMIARPVSRLVNDPRRDGVELIA